MVEVFRGIISIHAAPRKICNFLHINIIGIRIDQRKLICCVLKIWKIIAMTVLNVVKRISYTRILHLYVLVRLEINITCSKNIPQDCI